MTVAAGIEIMPGGGGPKGLLNDPSGTHKSGWGESLAGGNASTGDPASASAVWQSILTSLGVGPSERNAQEPSIEASLDSDLGPKQGNSTGSDGAEPFIPGSVISRIEVQISQSSAQVRLGQESDGLVEMEQPAGGRSGNFVERASQEKSATTAAEPSDRSSKDLAVSDPAGPSRKKTNLPAPDEAAAPAPQMAPFQSDLIPGHAIQQSFAPTVPHMQAVWQEKGVLTAALPDRASQLACAQGQTDLAATPASRAAVRTPSNPGAGKEGIDTPHALAGAESAQSRDQDLSASAPALLKGQIASGGQIGDNQTRTAGEWHSASPQVEAVPNAGPAVSVTGTSTPPKSLESPVATDMFSQNEARSGAAQGERRSWSPTQTGNRGPRPKSAAVAKGGEINAAARNPVQPTTGVQSANSIPNPEVSSHENRASAVNVDAVVPAHNHHPAGATEGSSGGIQAHAGSASAGAEPVPATAASGIAIVPPPAPSNGATSAAAVGHGGEGAGETFTALDAEGANRVTWVHAGGQQAEAGFEDPRLGWVSVRADVSGGAIHAALVPASADAAQVMGGHLDGLNAFLSEHHSAVETITLSAPSGRTHEFGELGSQGDGMQQRAGQESGQGSRQENGQEAANGFSGNRNADTVSGEHASTAASQLTQAVQQDTSVQQTNLGGRISLMA